MFRSFLQRLPHAASPTLSHRGFTLVEMIVAIVIIGVALAGVLSVLNLTTARSADPIQPKQATLVAESLLEEILAKPYVPPADGYVAACPGTCDRARFDDVGDYHGYASTGARALDDLNTAIPGLEGYDVAVAVSGPASIQGANCRTVGVIVTAGGNAYPLAAYRCQDE